MNYKNYVINFFFRILRLAGALFLIYISMVFYLALTERRNAYPRAITHKEAQNAINNKAKSLTCTLEDGVILKGFSIGSKDDPILLYYPDANEDAAQFLAELQNISGINLVSFNYRGCANNKGTPSAKTFLNDAKQIAECTQQINETLPKIIVGRGTGAILAAEQMQMNQKLILIDPVLSIADAISDKYKLLYPKFLVRAKEKLPIDKLNQKVNNIILLQDRKLHCDKNHIVINLIPSIHIKERGKLTLNESISEIIHNLL